VTLEPTDYVRLLERHTRCVVAWRGDSADWDLFQQRMDEAEQVAIATAEQEPLLQHLQVIETAGTQAAVTPPEATATVLAQLRSLQLVVAKLQHQVELLTPLTEETPPPKQDGGGVAQVPYGSYAISRRLVRAG
jgi:hypothetical protein